jgi:hypothetical protein
MANIDVANPGADAGPLRSAILGNIWTETLKATNYTLVATDQQQRLVFTAAATVTVPALGTLGNGFECEIINDSGGTVTIDGPGSTNYSMSSGDVVCVLEANGKQRVMGGASTVIS